MSDFENQVGVVGRLVAVWIEVPLRGTTERYDPLPYESLSRGKQ